MWNSILPFSRTANCGSKVIKIYRCTNYTSPSHRDRPHSPKASPSPSTSKSKFAFLRRYQPSIDSKHGNSRPRVPGGPGGQRDVPRGVSVYVPVERCGGRDIWLEKKTRGSEMEMKMKKVEVTKRKSSQERLWGTVRGIGSRGSGSGSGSDDAEERETFTQRKPQEKPGALKAIAKRKAKRNAKPPTPMQTRQKTSNQIATPLRSLQRDRRQQIAQSSTAEWLNSVPTIRPRVQRISSLSGRQLPLRKEPVMHTRQSLKPERHRSRIQSTPLSSTPPSSTSISSPSLPTINKKQKTKVITFQQPLMSASESELFVFGPHNAGAEVHALAIRHVGSLEKDADAKMSSRRSGSRSEVSPERRSRKGLEVEVKVEEGEEGDVGPVEVDVEVVYESDINAIDDGE